MAIEKNRKLLFVDTNILLDFYRGKNDAGIALAKHLDSIANCVIMTSQVEMEFKKHRQSVILESLKQMKPPERMARPGLFSEAKPFQALQSYHKRSEEQIKKLRSRLQTIFEKPTTHDEIYKVTQRLFTKRDEITLGRDKPIRFKIRRMAWKRFILGYPPRKQGDTSTGDAINWEWIVYCAQETGSEIVIVSRDSDYGVTHDDKSYLNDWLVREFRERVSKKRRIQLCAKLSEGLKQFQVNVSQEEEREEEAVITKASDSSEMPKSFFDLFEEYSKGRGPIFRKGLIPEKASDEVQKLKPGDYLKGLSTE